MACMRRAGQLASILVGLTVSAGAARADEPPVNVILVAGHMNSAALSSAVRPARREIAECDVRMGPASGSATVELGLAPDGRVASPVLVTSSLSSRAVEDCIVTNLARARFRSARDRVIRVEVSLGEGRVVSAEALPRQVHLPVRTSGSGLIEHGSVADLHVRVEMTSTSADPAVSDELRRLAPTMLQCRSDDQNGIAVFRVDIAVNGRAARVMFDPTFPENRTTRCIRDQLTRARFTTGPARRILVRVALQGRLERTRPYWSR
jgi:hypothetical protein